MQPTKFQLGFQTGPLFQRKNWARAFRIEPSKGSLLVSIPRLVGAGIPIGVYSLVSPLFPKFGELGAQAFPWEIQTLVPNSSLVGIWKPGWAEKTGARPGRPRLEGNSQGRVNRFPWAGGLGLPKGPWKTRGRPLVGFPRKFQIGGARGIGANPLGRPWFLGPLPSNSTQGFHPGPIGPRGLPLVGPKGRNVPRPPLLSMGPGKGLGFPKKTPNRGRPTQLGVGTPHNGSKDPSGKSWVGARGENKGPGL